MSNWIPSNAIPAYLVVPPQYANQVYAGLNRLNGNNLKCFLVPENRPNEVINEKQDGTSEVVSFGEDRWDFEVFFQVLGRETTIAAERIRKLNVPVYIYPYSGGTMQFGMPLIRGLGTDPLDTPTVTNNHTVSAGTTMYLPVTSAGAGESLVAVGDPALSPGIVTDNNEQVPFPLGTGYASFTPRINLLKWSSLNAVSQSGVCPTDGWCSAAGGGTADADRGLHDSPWLDGERTWWTTNTASIIHSYKFDLASLTGDPFFSCYAMVDGSMTVRIVHSGSPIASRSIPSGSGRFTTTFTGISPGSYANCVLEVVLASGNYGEIGHMTLINPGADVINDYLPYLSTDSAVQGTLSDDGLVVTGLNFRNNYQRPESTSSSRDNAMVASCLWQTGYSDDSRLTKHSILQLDHYTTSSLRDIEVRFGWQSTEHEFALYAGGTRIAGTTVPSFRMGDVFAVALGSGNNGSTSQSQLNVVNMRTGDLYTVNAPVNAVHMANRLHVGGGIVASTQCGGIIGGVSVASVPFSSLDDYAKALGNHDLIDLSRRTAGRWYHLIDASRFNQFNRQEYEGSLKLQELRAI